MCEKGLWKRSVGRKGLILRQNNNPAQSLKLVSTGLVSFQMMHKTLLDRVMRSPMSFFDTTPLGRIVNRQPSFFSLVIYLLLLPFLLLLVIRKNYFTVLTYLFFFYFFLNLIYFYIFFSILLLFQSFSNSFSFVMFSSFLQFSFCFFSHIFSASLFTLKLFSAHLTYLNIQLHLIFFFSQH